MRWSGFDGATNLELLREAGFTVEETEIVDQIEPEGSRINPMWFTGDLGAAKPAVWQALSTRSSGEVLSADSY